MLPSAYNGCGPYVFLSYARKSASKVYPFISELQKHFNVWYDYGIDYGQDFEDVIIDEINRCDVFIFAITKASLKSAWCKKELKYAASTKPNRFLFVLVDNVSVFPDWFRFSYSDYNYCKLSGFGSIGDAVESLISRNAVLRELKAKCFSSDPGHYGLLSGDQEHSTVGQLMQSGNMFEKTPFVIEFTDIREEDADESSALINESERIAFSLDAVKREAEENDMFVQAVDAVLESGNASVSFLQRKMVIGYGRAAKLITAMERCGIISSILNLGTPRSIYITPDQWSEIKKKLN